MKFHLKSVGMLSIAGVLCVTACNNGTPDNAASTTDSDSTSSTSVGNYTADSASSQKEDSTKANTIGNTNPDRQLSIS
ncbi:MAG: hypothetical protein ABIN89_00180 [Chitinophagaceae bacterium]